MVFHDYIHILRSIEATLISEGTKNLTETQIRAKMDEFRNYKDQKYNDEQFYWLLTRVVFYSGFNAATVGEHLPIIKKSFPDYKTVSAYGDTQVDQILQDYQMIRNTRKVKACVANAKIIKTLVQKHGSIQNYIDSFVPNDSFENLLLFSEELQCRFVGVGSVTSYHILTDLGLPVIKPDRVICRIFHRLGLIGSPKQILQAVSQGRKFSRITGEPERYVDIIFVAFGQTEFKDFGISQGICLDYPRCYLCSLAQSCSYTSSTSPS